MSRFVQGLVLSATLAGFLLFGGGAVAEQAPPTAENGDLRGIRGIETLPPKPPPRTWPAWLGLGLAGAAGAGVIAWRYARRPRPGPVLPAELWALRELDVIEALGLPESGQSERYHTLLSSLVRQYLEMRFQMQAPRQTTQEFLASARQSPYLAGPQQVLLREFLQQCDIAKFARANLSAEDCRTAARLARTFIRETAASAPLAPQRGLAAD